MPLCGTCTGPCTCPPGGGELDAWLALLEAGGRASPGDLVGALQRSPASVKIQMSALQAAGRVRWEQEGKSTRGIWIVVRSRREVPIYGGGQLAFGATWPPFSRLCPCRTRPFHLPVFALSGKEIGWQCRGCGRLEGEQETSNEPLQVSPPPISQQSEIGSALLVQCPPTLARDEDGHWRVSGIHPVPCRCSLPFDSP